MLSSWISLFCELILWIPRDRSDIEMLLLRKCVKHMGRHLYCKLAELRAYINNSATLQLKHLQLCDFANKDLVTLQLCNFAPLLKNLNGVTEGMVVVVVKDGHYECWYCLAQLDTASVESLVLSGLNQPLVFHASCLSIQSLTASRSQRSRSKMGRLSEHTAAGRTGYRLAAGTSRLDAMA